MRLTFLALALAILMAGCASERPVPISQPPSHDGAELAGHEASSFGSRVWLVSVTQADGTSETKDQIGGYSGFSVDEGATELRMHVTWSDSTGVGDLRLCLSINDQKAPECVSGPSPLELRLQNATAGHYAPLIDAAQAGAGQAGLAVHQNVLWSATVFYSN